MLPAFLCPLILLLTQLALNIIGTPSDLVTRGMLVRLDGTARIEHLARTRNMALTPLYQHYAATRGQQQHTHEGSPSSSRARRDAGSTSTSKMHGRRSLQGLVEPSLGGTSTGTSSPSSTWAGLLMSSSGSRRVQMSDAAHLPPGVLPWSPDYIVFINDVFFCPSMVRVWWGGGVTGAGLTRLMSACRRLLTHAARISCAAGAPPSQLPR